MILLTLYSSNGSWVTISRIAAAIDKCARKENGKQLVQHFTASSRWIISGISGSIFLDMKLFHPKRRYSSKYLTTICLSKAADEDRKTIDYRNQRIIRYLLYRVKKQLFFDYLQVSRLTAKVIRSSCRTSCCRTGNQSPKYLRECRYIPLSVAMLKNSVTISGIDTSLPENLSGLFP